MYSVYLDGKIVFKGTQKECNEYCKTHEWDYMQNPAYEEFERTNGIYC